MSYIIFVVRALWVVLSLLILSFSLYRLTLLESTRDVSELISLMCYGMMIISLPTGIASFVALMIIGIISSFIDINNKYVAALLVWIFSCQVDTVNGLH